MAKVCEKCDGRPAAKTKSNATNSIVRHVGPNGSVFYSFVLRPDETFVACPYGQGVACDHGIPGKYRPARQSEAVPLQAIVMPTPPRNT